MKHRVTIIIIVIQIIVSKQTGGLNVGRNINFLHQTLPGFCRRFRCIGTAAILLLLVLGTPLSRKQSDMQPPIFRLSGSASHYNGYNLCNLLDARDWICLLYCRRIQNTFGILKILPDFLL
jgi:hypothetical protein